MTHTLSRRALLGTALASAAACNDPAAQTPPTPPPAADAGSLVALLIGDTLDHAAPLGGDGIGPGVRRNIEMVRGLLARASTATGMPLRSTQILGGPAGADDFNCSSITGALRGVQAGPADAVFIYYAGHGFNLGPDTPLLRRQSAVPPAVLSLPTAREQRDMPYLYCGSYGDNPNVFPVAQQAARTGARLVVVISDSCNSYIPGTGPGPAPAAAPPAPVQDLRLISLFAEARGTVMMAAARPGNYAFYHPTGGVFTRSMMRALDALPSDRRTEWAALANGTAAKLKREKVTFEGRSDWPLDPVFLIEA